MTGFPRKTNGILRTLQTIRRRCALWIVVKITTFFLNAPTREWKKIQSEFEASKMYDAPSFSLVCYKLLSLNFSLWKYISKFLHKFSTRKNSAYLHWEVFNSRAIFPGRSQQTQGKHCTLRHKSISRDDDTSGLCFLRLSACTQTTPSSKARAQLQCIRELYPPLRICLKKLIK